MYVHVCMHERVCSLARPSSATYEAGAMGPFHGATGRGIWPVDTFAPPTQWGSKTSKLFQSLLPNFHLEPKLSPVVPYKHPTVFQSLAEPLERQPCQPTVSKHIPTPTIAPTLGN